MSEIAKIRIGREEVEAEVITEVNFICKSCKDSVWVANHSGGESTFVSRGGDGWINHGEICGIRRNSKVE